MTKPAPKRGRPAGTRSLVLFIQPDAEEWLRAEAERTGLAPSNLIELAVRRMMRAAEKKERKT